ncbi:MAG: hypothetical protein ACXABG_06515 [Promethearchaeota archaeon]
MKKLKLFKSKLVLFCIQILFLSLFVVIFNYEFQINFDVSTDPRAIEQQLIIRFLANLIMYNDTFGFVYISLTWFMVSLIPISIYNDFKKAYSMNITTFFFPNFFFYVFYWRYSEIYFNAQFPTYITNTIILSLMIVIESIVLSLLLKFIKKLRKDSEPINLEQIETLNRTECPKCGTQFNSIPKYCFNCNHLITNELGEVIGNAE